MFQNLNYNARTNDGVGACVNLNLPVTVSTMVKMCGLNARLGCFVCYLVKLRNIY